MKGFFTPSEVSKEPPVGLVPKCGACGLYKTCKSPRMEPFGKGKKKVLIIGEAPGKTEDEKGRPFVGMAGQELRFALDDIGVDLDRDAWTTNTLICRPPDNATPDIKQISYCRPNLLATLAKYQPRVVISLGRSALVSILTDYWRDVDALERWVGWKIPFEAHWLCPTYHPSYLMRMGNQLMDRRFREHLKAAFEIADNPPKQPNWKEHIEILYEEDEIYEALKEINSSDWVAFDYETNCLKPEYPKAAIYSCAVSNGFTTISYPWRGRAIEFTGKLLKSKHNQKIASNLKMEEKWTRKQFGHGVRNWGWDTMIAAHCLDNRPHICSIKFQALIKLGVPSYADEISPYLAAHGWYNRICQADMNQLLFYGGMDAILEHRVAMLQRREMGFV